MSGHGVAVLLGRHLRILRRRLFRALAVDLAAPLACALGLGVALQGGAPPPHLAAGLVVATAGLTAALEASLGAHRRLRAGPLGESVLASPLGLSELVGAEILFAAARAGLSAGLLALALLGLGWLRGADLALALVLGLLGSLAMAALALLSVALARRPEDLRAFLAGVALPCLLLSGAWFSPQALPDWGQALLWLNPLYHASAVAGAHAQASASAWLPLHLVALLALAGLPLWPAVRALRRTLQA